MLLQQGNFENLTIPEAYCLPEELLICGVVAVEIGGVVVAVVVVVVVVVAQPQAHCQEADQ
jgi:hypothetical protein